MNKLRTFYVLVIAVSVLAMGACATMAPLPAPMKTVDTKLGKVLTDGKGMTLYTFDKDTPGKSNCKGKCAKAWPPVMAGADAKASGKFSIITRGDGSKQWAYGSLPLYGWFKDKKPGDVTGDGLKGVWHVVHP
ncbi:MAG: hypothetical protein O7G88_12010 [bacterium]|nr:hypothetical protein [bacterium]